MGILNKKRRYKPSCMLQIGVYLVCCPLAIAISLGCIMLLMDRQLDPDSYWLDPIRKAFLKFFPENQKRIHRLT